MIATRVVLVSMIAIRIASPAARSIQTARERIALQLVLDQRGQAHHSLPVMWRST